jgi:hypothetical protein
MGSYRIHATRKITMKHTLLLGALAMATASLAHAQSIERVKLTDNDLSCQQIYTEIGTMDTFISLGGSQPAPAAVAQPAAAPDNNAAGIQVASAMLGQVAARSGNGGGFGNFLGGGSPAAGLGGLGGMFGSLAAAAQQAQQPPAAAPQPAAQASQVAVLAQQAQGRKEHLTSLFLSRPCKLSDVKK